MTTLKANHFQRSVLPELLLQISMPIYHFVWNRTVTLTPGNFYVPDTVIQWRKIRTTVRKERKALQLCALLPKVSPLQSRSQLSFCSCYWQSGCMDTERRKAGCWEYFTLMPRGNICRSLWLKCNENFVFTSKIIMCL